MARRTAAVIFTLGCLQAGAVSALGLGELKLDSFLNEPFKASVDLLNMEGLSQHQIRIRLATSDDFDRMGIDRAYFLTSLTFEVSIDSAGQGQVVMRSEGPVLEPYLDFIIEARWPSGRLLREYTVLVDPPVFGSIEAVAISVPASEVAEGGGSPESKKPQATVASSATQVKVAKSNLAPGEMPQREFGSDAASEPEAGNRYLIRRDDTLWQIARNGKPADTSIHQTMLDIQRLNPDAFIGGNINRMKAGYVIYLPESGDISSSDTASALEQVRQQNQDWRDGASTAPGRPSGPSLRISTSVAESAEVSDSSDDGSGSGSASDMANLEDLERSERDRAEVEGRLGAMSEQLDTLERIVSLKDDQIAALQSALAKAEAGAGGDVGEGLMTEAGVVSPLDEEGPISEGTSADLEAASESDIEESHSTEVSEVAEADAPPQAKKPVQRAAQEEGGFMGSILYIVGLLAALGIAVFVFIRRRRSNEEDEVPATDVFADIQLDEQALEVEPEPESQVSPVAQETVEEVVEDAAEETVEDAVEKAPGFSDSGAYGQRKNDEYADDSETGDALAEADIYIAYGRFPQALDLLKAAIVSEPGNAAYKLKVMEVCAELGDQTEVMGQYAEVKALDDAASLAAADDIVQAMERASGELQAPEDVAQSAPVGSLDLSSELELADLPDTDMGVLGRGDLPDLDLGDLGDTPSLERDFGSLEIEGFEGDLDDELDLSADFDAAEPVTGGIAGDEEDLVFAVDSDAMSTKLDLARAYLDMGDQDGARQIFEEVVAEGSDEQKEEAQALLERLD